MKISLIKNVLFNFDEVDFVTEEIDVHTRNLKKTVVTTKSGNSFSVHCSLREFSALWESVQAVETNDFE